MPSSSDPDTDVRVRGWLLGACCARPTRSACVRVRDRMVGRLRRAAALLCVAPLPLLRVAPLPLLCVAPLRSGTLRRCAPARCAAALRCVAPRRSCSRASRRVARTARWPSGSTCEATRRSSASAAAMTRPTSSGSRPRSGSPTTSSVCVLARAGKGRQIVRGSNGRSCGKQRQRAEVEGTGTCRGPLADRPVYIIHASPYHSDSGLCRGCVVEGRSVRPHRLSLYATYRARERR